MLIDPRAGSGDIATSSHLSAARIDAMLCPLDSADVCFTGNGPRGSIDLGIELKSIDDLLSSIYSGRLQGQDGQISRMVETYDISFLVWYGEYRLSDDGQLETRINSNKRFFRRGKSRGGDALIESFLLSLNDIGVRTRQLASGKDEAIRFIIACYKRYQKPWERHKLFRSLNRTQGVGLSDLASLVPDIDKRMLRKIRTAATLPHINFERGLAAAKFFRSIRDMAIAGEDRWRQIDGVGPVIASEVVAALRDGES